MKMRGRMRYLLNLTLALFFFLQAHAVESSVNIAYLEARENAQKVLSKMSARSTGITQIMRLILSYRGLTPLFFLDSTVAKTPS